MGMANGKRLKAVLTSNGGLHGIRRRVAAIACAVCLFAMVIFGSNIPNDLRMGGKPLQYIMLTSEFDPGRLCAAPPASSCYELIHGRASTLTLLMRCDVSEFYPELTLSQKDLRVTVLGTLVANTHVDRPAIWRQHQKVDFTLAYMFDFAASGIVAGVTNLSLKLYFHCIADLYGESPRVRSRNQSDDVRPMINIPVELDNALATIYLQEDLEENALQFPCIHPLAVNTSTTRAARSSIHETAARPIKMLGARITEQSDFEWVHLVGDSVTRGLYIELCALCPTSPKDPFDLLRVGDGEIMKETNTCMCNETRTIVHYDLAWLDWTPLINRTGARMSEFALPGSFGASLNKRALLTFLSLGSHRPDYFRTRLEYAVPEFVQQFHSLTNGKLVLMLTTAVCIEKIPSHHERTHGSWEMLLRNNYRLRVLNELIAKSGSELNLPVVDLFSVSLSAGCGFYFDAIHFDRSLQAALIAPIVSRFLFRMR
jgi:hypothetical protein